MKSLPNLTAALIGSLILSATAALADPKIVAGCEVKLAESGNWYEKADPACQMATTGGNGTDAFFLAGLKAIVVAPEEPEAAE